jgi:hypothetical protein
MPYLSSELRTGAFAVSITHATSSSQVRIAFSASLVRKFDLVSYRFISIFDDDGARILTFTPEKEPTSRGRENLRLIRDGGTPNRKAISRAVFIAKSRFPGHLPFGKFVADCGRTSFSIAYSEAPPRLMDSERLTDPGLAPRKAGVYVLFDAAGRVLDIGMSANDVRGRIRTKLKEQQATSYSFAPMKDEKTALHWERQFQLEHEQQHGKLPKFSAAASKGCGCTKCKR